jgi:adenylate cyclase
VSSSQISGNKRSRNAAGKSAIVAATGALIAAVLLTYVDDWRSDSDVDIQDRLLRVAPGAEIRDDLVFLGIDERSMQVDVGENLITENPILALMKARFPWDRRVYAHAIDKLLNAGARLVVIDIVLAGQSSPEADTALAETIARHRDRVILASAFGPVASKNDEFTITEPWDEFLGEDPNWTRCGFANFRPDDTDSIVRSANFTTTLTVENGNPARPDEPVFLSLAAEVIDALGKPVPKGRHELRFAKNENGLAHDVYEPISIIEIFDPNTWEKRHQSGEAFQDKIVLIGPAAPRLKDEHQTPVGLLAGPQLHLQAITCGLENSFVTRWQPAIGMSLAGVFFAWLIARISRHPFVAIASTLGVAVIVVIGAYALATTPDILTGFSTFMIVIGAGAVTGQTHSLVTERFERGRLHREFRRFVSRDVADTLVNQPEIYQQAATGRKRRLAVLFSDVRGFTSRSEIDDPERLVGQLNEYFSAMVAVVFRHGGTLDKFIGDAVMAHWGALDDGKDDNSHALNAIAAARDMIVELDALNASWADRNLQPYHIGIGIHLGDAVAGEIGSVDRTEFAVIGDAVNLASRTEGLCKLFKTDLLCTGAVAKAVGFPKTLRRLANVRVSGRKEPVEIWGSANRDEADAAYKAALETFEEGSFDKAAQAFASLHDDGPAGRLYEWSNSFRKEPPTDWDGVISMTGK